MIIVQILGRLLLIGGNYCEKTLSESELQKPYAKYFNAIPGST